MSHPLPLCLLLFTSTAGHFGYYDIYQTTVSHLEKQCFGNLGSVFAALVAHIKVRPREEEKARFPAMVDWLRGRGFTVVVSEGEWSRGMSMQASYLSDIDTISHFDRVQSQPFTLFLEDDSPINPGGSQIMTLFDRDCRTLIKDKDALCVRYARPGDTAGLAEYSPTQLASPWYHFQPNIVRSRDLMLTSNIIRTNWSHFVQYQCEMAFSIAMKRLMGDDRSSRFVVYRPESAYSYHLGGPDYLVTKASLC